jgi:hypothetical protein
MILMEQTKYGSRTHRYSTANEPHVLLYSAPSQYDPPVVWTAYIREVHLGLSFLLCRSLSSSDHFMGFYHICFYFLFLHMDHVPNLLQPPFQIWIMCIIIIIIIIIIIW